jgi:2-C-methyl-D-erythritol 4-phosphate cytidylyltransferase
VDARTVVIVPAAGSGERLGRTEPKAFIEVGGRAMLVRAAESALESGAVDLVVVAVPLGLEAEAAELLVPLAGRALVVTGAATRLASVRAALAVVPDTAEIILCHDAARPLATPALFRAVIAGLVDADAVVPALPVADTVKRVRGGSVVGTEPREELALAQTPQAFRAAPLRDAHSRAERAGQDFTDDASALEWAGYRIRVVPGEPGNFKITSAEDLARAEAARG